MRLRTAKAGGGKSWTAVALCTPPEIGVLNRPALEPPVLLPPFPEMPISSCLVVSISWLSRTVFFQYYKEKENNDQAHIISKWYKTKTVNHMCHRYPKCNSLWNKKRLRIHCPNIHFIVVVYNYCDIVCCPDIFFILIACDFSTRMKYFAKVVMYQQLVLLKELLKRKFLPVSQTTNCPLV